MPRMPAVVGMFYDLDPDALRRTIDECFLGRLGPGNVPTSEVPSRKSGSERHVLGLVSPHAGYVYSGSAAAFAYDALASDGIPDVAVILGPNHHGLGVPVAVSTEDEWVTPLGPVRVDLDVARSILARSRYARDDEAAHSREHSIEVQLPFLQYAGGDATRIVPIAFSHLYLADAKELAADLGPAIAQALAGKSAVVIASTDFSHYVSKALAETRDAKAIDRILHLDPQGLLETVEANSISMCGATGVAVMIEACKQLGARSAQKLTYYTSGDVTGDTMQVVGYAALAVEA